MNNKTQQTKLRITRRAQEHQLFEQKFDALKIKWNEEYWQLLEEEIFHTPLERRSRSPKRFIRITETGL